MKVVYKVVFSETHPNSTENEGKWKLGKEILGGLFKGNVWILFSFMFLFHSSFHNVFFHFEHLAKLKRVLQLKEAFNIHKLVFTFYPLARVLKSWKCRYFRVCGMPIQKHVWFLENDKKNELFVFLFFVWLYSLRRSF